MLVCFCVCASRRFGRTCCLHIQGDWIFPSISLGPLNIHRPFLLYSDNLYNSNEPDSSVGLVTSLQASKENVKVKVTLEQATKAQRVSRGISVLFNLGAKWGWVLNATPWRLYPRERPGTYCIGGWVGFSVGLDGAENLTPTGIRSPDRPAGSESLCSKGIGGISSGLKVAEAWGWSLTPSSANVKNKCAKAPLSLFAFVLRTETSFCL